MIIDDFVFVRCHTNNKRDLINKGYQWENKKEIKVRVLDLSNGSSQKLNFKCDYCGDIFLKRYSHHNEEIARHGSEKRDCCNKKECKSLKRREYFDRKVKEHIFPLIKDEFKNRGYTLVSEHTDYKNNMTKLKYICNKHEDKGVLEISWNTFKQCHGCRHCANENLAKMNVLDYEFVKSEFEKRGYRLLEEVYISAKTPMRYICPCHPNKIQTTLYTNLKKGSGCKDCAVDARRGENSVFWKGGLTPLNHYLRREIKEWKIASLNHYDFKCVITNKASNNLDIHHLKGFNLILGEVINELNLNIKENISEYNENDLMEITKLTIEKHQKYGYGVPLLPEIHILFHRLYGYKDNTPEQFEEFKLRFRMGEFDETIAS